MTKSTPFSLSRRQFVGTAAASAFALDFFPSRVFGANERVNIADIGVGGKGVARKRGLKNPDLSAVALVH